MPGNSSILELQPRDREVLHTLTRCVRVLSIAQIARTWWHSVEQAEHQARRRLMKLEQDGWIEIVGLMAHPELSLSGPVGIWQPGKHPLDFHRLARQLQTRWTQPEAAVTCVIGTQQAGVLLGGVGGRLPRDSEATHDLHLAAVYLRMRNELPTRAKSWIPEADLPAGPGVKVPDALVRDGRYRTAIEFGGQYAPAKLEAFHAYCCERGWGYELW